MLDITGPRAFQRGFVRYFKKTLVLTPTEYPGGVRLLNQQLDKSCMVYPIVDQWRNVTLLYHKYPRYWEDMKPYSNQAHYS
jgi:hypothetical protein